MVRCGIMNHGKVGIRICKDNKYLYDDRILADLPAPNEYEQPAHTFPRKGLLPKLPLDIIQHIGMPRVALVQDVFELQVDRAEPNCKSVAQRSRSLLDSMCNERLWEEERGCREHRTDVKPPRPGRWSVRELFHVFER